MTAGQRGTRAFLIMRAVVVGLIGIGALVWFSQGLFGWAINEIVHVSNRVANLENLWGFDYGAYYDAGHRLAAGGSLYLPLTLDGPFQPGPRGLFLYSPIFGAAMLPATTISYDASSWLWYVAHVVALIAACAIMPVRREIRVLAFASVALSFAGMKDAALGNISVLLLLPTAMAWRWLDQPLGAVGQALAISVRPILGIIPLWQLLRRQWRPVLWTAISGLVLVLISLSFVGIDAYRDYLTLLGNISGPTGVHANYDLSSVLVRAGVSLETANLVPIASAIAAIAAVLLSLRRDREAGFIIVLGASLMMSPLLWDHYLVMLVFTGAFVASRGHWWALALPLATWLPKEISPLLVAIAVVLPFLVRPADDPDPSASEHPGWRLPSPSGATDAGHTV